MATVTIRYWAAAKEAAGVAEEVIEAVTLDEALVLIVSGRQRGDRLGAVLARASFLVNGDPAGRRAAADVILPEGSVVEVLPAFAGGLARFSPGVGSLFPGAGSFSPGLGSAPRLAAHWRDIPESVRLCAVRSRCA